MINQSILNKKSVILRLWNNAVEKEMYFFEDMVKGELRGVEKRVEKKWNRVSPDFSQRNPENRDNTYPA
ncbi:MAG TPA: hypothetical protein PLN69_10705, partial [bacterium]|nr:hypothetical protein [bacterium]